jgi:glyoxylase I family protein
MPMQSPRDIALDMGRAEREEDVPALEGYLHNDLVFRRVDGSIVDKRTFLAGVAARDRLDSEILEDEEEVAESTSSVVVTLIVRTRGGSFRNVRVFVRDYGAWQCKLWVNTKLEAPPALQVEMLHHVSLPVADLGRSKRFYEDVLCLRESRIRRPDPPRFTFKGAWYQVGAGQLHLIVPEEGHPPPTFREGKKLDSRDVHFAVRVYSFEKALTYLESRGYSAAADVQDDFKQMKVSRNERHEGAGFPQIYILDPDRHTIEINAERLD